MRDAAGDEERLTLADRDILNHPVFPDFHDDVAFELEEILLRVGDVEVVPGIGSADHHHEEIAAVVEIFVPDRRLELVAVFLDPFHNVDGRAAFIGCGGHGYRFS